MSPITTHVLDIAAGRPAEGVAIVLELAQGETWRELGRGATNADGRLPTLLSSEHRLQHGVYRLRFATADYFASRQVATFYPEVTVIFRVDEPDKHYHVPLLVSPFGYSTYRGS